MPEITRRQKSLKHWNYYGATSICFVVNMGKRNPLTKKREFLSQMYQQQVLLFVAPFPKTHSEKDSE